jgi:hypothetical protein
MPYGIVNRITGIGYLVRSSTVVPVRKRYVPARTEYRLVQEMYDMKDMLAMIHLNISSLHCALNSVRSMETGWGNQMNGDATFGFCGANVDMLCLGFNSMGCVNNPAC